MNEKGRVRLEKVRGMRPPRIGPRQVVYRDRYQQIYRVAADFGEFTKEYFVRDCGERAGMVVVRDGSVLLVRQYRLLIDGLSLEVPGGRVDEGETAEAAAIRECMEETHLLCRDVKPLVRFQPGLDTIRNSTHLFYTDDFVEIGGSRGAANEVDGHVWIPLARCIDMVFAGTIVDSFSIVALLAYHSLMHRS